MLVDGQWLVSHVNGTLNTHKPPLFFWLIAISSIPYGAVTEFTARLPSVLAALGTLWLTMRLGRRWYGPKTGALTGVILATTFMFWDKARWSQTDSLLCFLIWVALSAYDNFRSGEGNGRSAGILFWLAAAFAVLAKGPVGLLLPLGVALVTTTVDKEWKNWRKFAPLLGPATFVAICGAWLVTVNFWGPPDYSVLGALREHFVDRGIHGIHHVRPPWYYFDRLPSSILPWSGLIPGALYLAWKRRSIKTDRMGLVTCIFIFLFFSISTEKRDLYMLPAFPAWALLITNLVGTICHWESEHPGYKSLSTRWVTIGHGIVAGVLLLTGLALPFVAPNFEEVPYWMACTIGGILIALGSTTLFFAFRSKPFNMILATSIAMCAAYLFTTAVIYPAMKPLKSARSFAIKIKETTAASRNAGNDVVAWRIDNLANAFAYYSDGAYTLETRDPEVLVEHLSQPTNVYAVVMATDLDEELLDKLAHVWVIDETRLSRRDLLLVSNMPHEGALPLTELD